MAAWEDVWNSNWYDFEDAKNGDEYLLLLLSRKRRWKSFFEFFTLSLSAGGIISTVANAKVSSLILLGLIALTQLLAITGSSFVATNKEIENLCQLRLMYCQLSENYETVYKAMKYSQISEEEAQDAFNECRKFKMEKIEPKDTEIGIRGESKKLIRKARLKTVTYLKPRYYV